MGKGWKEFSGMQFKKTITFTALLATVGVAETALADYEGTYKSLTRFYAADGATQTNAGDAAFAVLDVYANFSKANTHGFDNADTRVLSTYNTNVQLLNAGGTSYFYHNDLTGSGDDGQGSWKPSFSFDVPGSANSTIDSFVTINGGVGPNAATNATTPDPNFGTATSADIFNADIGWYLNPPTSPQADVDSNYDVWLGRFVVTGDTARGGAYFAMEGIISFNYGSGTGLFSSEFGGEFMWIPAPGALAMLGIGGVAVRRRRR